MIDTNKLIKIYKTAKVVGYCLEVAFVVVFIALCVTVHCQRKTIKEMRQKATTEQVVSPVPMVLPATAHIINK